MLIYNKMHICNLKFFIIFFRLYKKCRGMTTWEVVCTLWQISVVLCIFEKSSLCWKPKPNKFTTGLSGFFKLTFPIKKQNKLTVVITRESYLRLYFFSRPINDQNHNLAMWHIQWLVSAPSFRAVNLRKI